MSTPTSSKCVANVFLTCPYSSLVSTHLLEEQLELHDDWLEEKVVRYLVMEVNTLGTREQLMYTKSWAT